MAENLQREAVVLQRVADTLSSSLSEGAALKFAPIRDHIEATLLSGLALPQVPLGVLAELDNRLKKKCQEVTPTCEHDPALMVSVLRQAAFLCDETVKLKETEQQGLWMQRNEPFSLNLLSTFCSQISEGDTDQQEKDGEVLGRTQVFRAVLVPCEGTRKPRELVVSVEKGQYFLTAIAEKLGFSDAGRLLLSRSKSDRRFYFPLPPSSSSDKIDGTGQLSARNEPRNEPRNELLPIHEPRNECASWLSGQNIYGDAILAACGSTYHRTPPGCRFWASDVRLDEFYKMVHSKNAEGAYQLNRNAPLISRLSEPSYNPSNWQNKPPKALLETVYSAHRSEIPGGSLLYECHYPDKENPTLVVCELSFLAPWEKSGGVVLYKSEKCLSQKDAENSVAFLALKKFKEFHENRAGWLLPWMEKGERMGEGEGVGVGVGVGEKTACEGRGTKIPRLEGDFSVLGKDLEGGEGPPPLGTVVTVDYIIRWKNPHIDSSLGLLAERDPGLPNSLTVKRGEEEEKGTAESSLKVQKGSTKVGEFSEREEEVENGKWTEVIEENKKFKFELGSRSVIEPFNSCVSSLKEGETASFSMTLPHSWVFEVAQQRCKERERRFSDELSFPLSQLVECEVKLVSFERKEERGEGAFFSPPLSKQRLSFALNLIEKLGAKTLVDLGCGSGALLKQLPGKCMVENFVGVDISTKALRVAAKAMEKTVDNLRSKDSEGSWNSKKLKSAIIYKGSITEFDSRIQGFDLATCIEVVEHLDPEPLSEVGQAILGNLRPKVLLISTPNIEYNVLLQSAGGKGPKLRNEDHRFEWTRNEFQKWADKIATSFGYNVEYSGVGGNGEEPGFATQIAVFTRDDEGLVCERLQQMPITKQETNVNVYEIVWQWPNDSGSNI